MFHQPLAKQLPGPPELRLHRVDRGPKKARDLLVRSPFAQAEPDDLPVPLGEAGQGLAQVALLDGGIELPLGISELRDHPVQRAFLLVLGESRQP